MNKINSLEEMNVDTFRDTFLTIHFYRTTKVSQNVIKKMISTIELYIPRVELLRINIFMICTKFIRN